VQARRTIMAAHRIGDQIALTLDNGTRRYDHLMLATGYHIDIDKMNLLDPRLRQRVVRYRSLPVLSNGLQSSVPGLHFVGAAAVGSYGPLLRFIAGAGFAAKQVTRAARRGARVTNDLVSINLAVSPERV